jgi:DNA-binding XRE family transcriptional regulator
MNHFRKLQSLSQAGLASACGVGRQCISAIESGLYLPSPELAGQLKTILNYPGLSDSTQILTSKEIRAFAVRRPFEMPLVNREPWQRTQRSYPHQIRALGLPDNKRAWVENHLEAETALEGVGTLSLAALPSTTGVWASPQELAYRLHCVIDHHGQALGERLLPALRWTETEFDCLLWFQIRLLSGNGLFRPDALALIKTPEAVFWRDLEMDGPHHRSAEQINWDHQRQLRSGLECIRVDSQTILKLGLAARLRAEFSRLRNPIAA